MPFANVPGAGPGTLDRPEVGVRVQWAKPDGPVRLAVLPMIDGMPGSADAEHAEWAMLGRDGLNALIRHARQARNDVFGRDE